METWIGINDAQRLLKELPEKLRQRTIAAAAAKALLPVKARAKNEFVSKETGAQGGYSKARMLSRSLKVMRLKDKRNPGARLVLREGRMVVGSRNWRIWQYGKLFADGAKDVRYTRSTKARRGRFRGFGDPVKRAGDSSLATLDNQFGEAILKIIDKEAKKYG